jgi:hypothetical protein
MSDLVLHVLHHLTLHCLRHCKDGWTVLHLIYATFLFLERYVTILNSSLFCVYYSIIHTHSLISCCIIYLLSLDSSCFLCFFTGEY